MITFLILSIAIIAANADDARLRDFLDNTQLECKTMVARCYYTQHQSPNPVTSTARGITSTIGNLFGNDTVRTAKQHIDAVASVFSPVQVRWTASHWGQICDPTGDILQIALNIDNVPSATAPQLELMARLREHNDCDQEAMNEYKRTGNVDQLLSPINEVPVPSQPWVWEDYVLLFVGVPLVLTVFGLASKVLL